MSDVSPVFAPVVRPRPLLATGDPRAMQVDQATPGGAKAEPGESKALPRRGKPASYTRFVLPLPYWLERRHLPDPPEHWWEEATHEDWLHSPARGEAHPPQDVLARVFEASLDRERADYFTRETSDVLFRRARWMTLRGEKLTDRFLLRVADASGKAERAVAVRLRPPALVCFEFPSTPRDDGEREVGALQHAMLVVEVWWDPPEEPERAPRLDDALVLNELFRYFLRPYERHSRAPSDEPDGPEPDGPDAHQNYGRVLRELPVDWRPAKPGQPNPTVGAALEGGEDPRLSAYLARWEWMIECPLRLPPEGHPDRIATWWRLVPADWIGWARRRARGEDHAAPGRRGPEDCGWLLYADNRAFVWTCVVTDHPGLGRRIRELAEITRPMDPTHGYWLRLVNMDPLVADPTTCTAYEARWADERTYRRWAHFGALQGFNYHGGAMLTGPCDEPPTWRHFGGMYFDQALLLLYVRVALFRFSHELSQLSAEARRKADDRDSQEAVEALTEGFERLRFEFAMFTNLYQFPLLSNQQQGLELYTLCRRQMDLGDLFDEVRSEIETTHQFLSQCSDRRGNESMMRLTWVASAGLVLALAIGLLGSDVFMKSALGLGDAKERTSPGALIGYLVTPFLLFLVLMVIVWQSSTHLDLWMHRLRRELRKRPPLVRQRKDDHG